MNIPNLPTDNLYKFIALVGVVIFLICTIYPSIIILEIGDEATRINTEIGELNFEIILLKESCYELKNDIYMADSMISKYEYDDSTKVKIILTYLIESLQNPEKQDYNQLIFDNKYDIFLGFKLIEENIGRFQEINETLNEIRLKSHKIDRKTELVKLKNKDQKIFIWFWFIGFIVGIIMMSRGFRLWYIRVQKPLDEKLKKEIKEQTHSIMSNDALILNNKKNTKNKKNPDPEGTGPGF